MLRYMKLKNYRSFTDLSFDMTGKNGVPKKLIILYGENGVGKTNLVNVLDTLNDTFSSLSLRNMIMSFLENNKDSVASERLTSLYNYLDASRIIKDNKTIDSEDNMCIEVGFCLNDKNGTYKIEFDNERIVSERLEYVLNRNKIAFYDIQDNERKINPQILSNAYAGELMNMAEKYWGKHSIMAILFYAVDEYTNDFIKEAFCEPLHKIIDYFRSISTYLLRNESRRENIVKSRSLLQSFDEGEVDEIDEKIIIHTEKLIDAYFKDAYTDISGVYYRKDKKDNKIKYSLYFQKKISGKTVNVRYDEESRGTRNMIMLLPYFLAAMDNQVVVIDEIDNGIHDILLNAVIKNLADHIGGQLFMTTHNTMFLAEYSFKDSIYFIVEDLDGYKEIKSINDFGYRIQQNSNVMANYLDEKFSKSPWNGTNVDFVKLLDIEKEEV